MKILYKTYFLLFLNSSFLVFAVGIPLDNSFSQSPLVKLWDYRFGGDFGEELKCIQQTIDFGFIIGGSSTSGISGDKTQPSWGDLDFWVVKMDSVGNKLWDKRFGGSEGDELSSLQQTSDGGYILGGSSRSDISGDKTQSNWDTTLLKQDYWIIKIDSLGNKQWDKRFGGTNYDILYSLQQTSDNGYILGGRSASGVSGDKTQPAWAVFDYWIVKTDSLGNKQWDKDYGGTGSDYLFSLRQTADGGYILGGSSSSGISGDKTEANWDTVPSFTHDYWMVKIDSIGNKEWDKRFGGTDQDILYSLKQTTDKGYILGGLSLSGMSGDKTQSSWGGNDYWIVKTDSLGGKVWDKRFGGTNTENEFGNIELASDGGYLLSGTSWSGMGGNKTEDNMGANQEWIIKINANGIKKWDKTIFSFDEDYNPYIIQAINGCYVTANSCQAGIGGYKSQPSWGYRDYWIVKFYDITTSAPQLLNTQLPFPISPNPSSGIFQINFPSSSNQKTNYTLEVINTLGKTVFNSDLRLPASDLQTKIDVSFLPKGIYVLRLCIPSGKINDGASILSSKLIIE